MNTVVVDASVVVKLMLPELGSDAADALVAERRPLIAPELLYAECANVFWKRARREGLGSPEVDRLLEDLMDLRLESVPLRT
jgi:predicted nucleic acid-binding protein